MLHFVGLKPQKEERLHWDAIQQSIRESQLQRRPGVWGGCGGEGDGRILMYSGSTVSLSVTISK